MGRQFQDGLGLGIEVLGDQDRGLAVVKLPSRPTLAYFGTWNWKWTSRGLERSW
jgi:hypothetical protein